MKGAGVVRLLREKKDYLRREFGVRELLLFGSFPRGDEGEGSDVDLV
ncbi:nucleotidyltransferase family protein [Thermovibrio sp.]